MDKTIKQLKSFSLVPGVLKIIQVNETHNHELVAPETYPENRRLASHEKERAEDLIEMGVSAKKVLGRMNALSGKKLILKDIHNLRQEYKKKKAGGLNDAELLLNEVETYLQHDQEAVVYFDVPDNELNMLFVQTSEMRDLYSKFPEILFLDATYCVNKKQMPLYVLMCQDGEGRGRVVAYAIVRSESYERVSGVISTFKKENPKCSDLTTVVVDKDLTELRVIKELFPQVHIVICKFHVLKAFKKETATIFPLSTRDTVRNLLEKIVHSRSFEEYDTQYTELCSVLSDSPNFLSYYNRNWHSIRQNWVAGLYAEIPHLGNTTNNRMESHNSKIKQVVSSSSSLHEMFRNLLSLSSLMSKESSHVAVTSSVKTNYSTKNMSSEALVVSNSCTKYAASIILNELGRMDDNQMVECQSGNVKSKKSNQTYLVQCPSPGVYTCSCSLYSSHRLPCRHIFVYLSCHDIVLAHVILSLVPHRFLNEYQMSLTVTDTPSALPSDHVPLNVVSTPAPVSNPSSKFQRFRQLSAMCKELCDVGCLSGGADFDNKVSSLKQLLEYWQDGIDYSILPIASSSPRPESVQSSPPTIDVIVHSTMQSPPEVSLDPQPSPQNPAVSHDPQPSPLLDVTVAVRSCTNVKQIFQDLRMNLKEPRTAWSPKRSHTDGDWNQEKACSCQHGEG